ncbi:DsbA family protein [Myxococcota bacterium]|nr:DsbA family protein [Myxococcota bacterium]
MSPRFEDQGGAATMSPAPWQRWLTSKLLSHWIRPASTQKRRDRAERVRQKKGEPHRVEYFHQVEDGYSHLSAQLLQRLLDAYDVELVCHLVDASDTKNQPEPDLLLALSRTDASRIAPHYGLRFPVDAVPPRTDRIERARCILAAATQADFPAAAVAVGEALWSGDPNELERLERRRGSTDPTVAADCIARGNQHRQKLKHYSSAMFHYAGEWYWGADRFYLLEKQLDRYAGRRRSDSIPICPRPPIEMGPLRDDGSLTLEFYPSLRSPYTSMIFDKTLELAERTGVDLVNRPVLPMVMRGVPATLQKGWYIFSDAAREAEALGIEWGRYYDPIGQPTRNAYSLYPWAQANGRGTELLQSFLHAAFFEGINTNNDRGMRWVVESAGLPWSEALPLMGNDDWEDELEENRQAMYEFGSWGVPSFRLLGADGEPVLGVWGQDRLWLVAREIQRLLSER